MKVDTEFILQGGRSCPYCKTGNTAIEIGDPNPANDGSISFPAECSNPKCRKHWTAIYQVAGFIEPQGVKNDTRK